MRRRSLAATSPALSTFVSSKTKANSSPPRRATTSFVAHLLAQSRGHLAQQLVARGVAHGVVHHLEVVEIEEHHCDAGGAAVGSRARLGDAPAQRPAIEQPRQHVGLGAAMQLVLDAPDHAQGDGMDDGQAARADARRGGERPGRFGDQRRAGRLEAPGDVDHRNEGHQQRGNRIGGQHQDPAGRSVGTLERHGALIEVVVPLKVAHLPGNGKGVLLKGAQPLMPMRFRRNYDAESAPRRRSRVTGKRGLRASFSTIMGPGVWPIGRKRATRRASASSAFTGKVA